jgi:hypothetical protein
MLSIGQTGKSAGRILSFLDLPYSELFATNTFIEIEKKVEEIQQRHVCNCIIVDSMKNEIIAHMKKKNRIEISYKEWIAKPKTSCVEMLGWHK